MYHGICEVDDHFVDRLVQVRRHILIRVKACLSERLIMCNQHTGDAHTAHVQVNMQSEHEHMAA